MPRSTANAELTSRDVTGDDDGLDDEPVTDEYRRALMKGKPGAPGVAIRAWAIKGIPSALLGSIVQQGALHLSS